VEVSGRETLAQGEEVENESRAKQGDRDGDGEGEKLLTEVRRRGEEIHVMLQMI
jgi:hypothetical protein